MHFSKKTLVVIMLAAFHAGVVTAASSGTEVLAPEDRVEEVSLVSKTFQAEEGQEKKSHEYYLAFLKAGENHDGVGDAFAKTVEATANDDVVWIVENNQLTTTDVSPYRDSTIMAAGLVSDSIGKDVSSRIKFEKSLNINVKNHATGEDDLKSSAFGISTLIADDGSTEGVFGKNVEIVMENCAANSDLVGMKQHVLFNGDAVSTFYDDIQLKIFQNGSGITNGFVQDTQLGGTSDLVFSKKLDIVAKSLSGNVEGLSSRAENECLFTKEQIDAKQLVNEIDGFVYDDFKTYLFLSTQDDMVANSIRPLMDDSDDFWSSYVNVDTECQSKRDSYAIYAEREWKNSFPEELESRSKFEQRLEEAMQTGNWEGITEEEIILYKNWVDSYEPIFYKWVFNNDELISLYSDLVAQVQSTFKPLVEAEPWVEGKSVNTLEGRDLEIQVVSEDGKSTGLAVASEVQSEVSHDWKDVHIIATSNNGPSYGVRLSAKNKANLSQTYGRLRVESKGDSTSSWGVQMFGADESNGKMTIREGAWISAPNGMQVLSNNAQDAEVANTMIMDVSGVVDLLSPGGVALQSSGDGAAINIHGGGDVPVRIQGDAKAEERAVISINLLSPGSMMDSNVYSYSGSNSTIAMGDGALGRGRLVDKFFYKNEGGNINLKMGGGSQWLISQDEAQGEEITVSKLDMSNGALVVIDDEESFEHINIGELSGDGGVFEISLKADENINNASTINIRENFSGTHFLDINLKNDGEPEKAVGSVLVRAKAGEGDFLVNEEAKGIFWQRVELAKLLKKDVSEDRRHYKQIQDGDPILEAGEQKEPFEMFWVIKSIDNLAPADKPTPLVDSIVSSRLAGHALWSGRLADDTLMERLGDIRLSGEESNGLWIRTKHSRVKLDDVYSLKMNTHHYELGYDYSSASDNARVFWGGSFNWDDGKADLRKGDSKVRSVGIGLYRSQTFDNGWYVDTIARIDRQRNKLKSTDADGKAYDGSVNQWGFSLSGEVGRTFDIAKGMFVQPEAQLTFGRLNGKSFTTCNDVSVDSDAVKALISRIGVKAGMTFDSNKGNVYAKADLLREWMGKNVVSLATKAGSLEVTEKNRKTWGRVGLGANYHFNKAFSAHGSFDYDIKSRWGDHASVNVGVRYSF